MSIEVLAESEQYSYCVAVCSETSTYCFHWGF